MNRKTDLLRNTLITLLVLMGLAVLAVVVGYPLLNGEIPTNVIWLISVLMGADAICYFVAAWGVAKNIKWLYPLTTALLIVNALGVIFDDIGVIDVIFMVANTLILILLLNYRKKLQKVANDSK